jgi:hypothetical protein
MKPSLSFACYLLGIALCVWVLLPLAVQADKSPRINQSESKPSRSIPLVRFDDGRLTVKVRNIPLRELLKEVAWESGLALVLLSPLQNRINIEFHGLRLDNALRRILRHRNFVVEYGEQADKAGKSVVIRPAKLWVFGNEDGDYPAQTIVFEKAKPRLSQGLTALDEAVMQASFESANPENREDAVEMLGQSGHPDGIAKLSVALTDENTDVREAAIDALADIGGDEAAQALAVALVDENAALREGAVDALGKIGGETAIQVLARALQDNDEFVRETAAEVLSQIKSQSN